MDVLLVLQAQQPASVFQSQPDVCQILVCLAYDLSRRDYCQYALSLGTGGKESVGTLPAEEDLCLIVSQLDNVLTHIC